MSLDSIMRTAITGLNTSQQVLQTTAANVANVNTPGYARQVTYLSNLVVDGQTAGVEVDEIRRIVNQFIQREILSASGSTGFYETQASFHNRIQSLLGDPQSENTLNSLISDVFESFASLAVDPSQTARRLAAIDSIRQASQELNRLAGQIQAMREDADVQIGNNIDSINVRLEKIFTLNATIAAETGAGRDAPGLEDQRDRLIQELSEVLDIRALPQPNGMINISTAGGVVLLDTRLRQLEYDPVGTVDTSSTFDDIKVYRVDPISGLRSLTNSDFGPTLRTGEIRALIDMRDKELPEIAEVLGRIASEMTDQLNGVHNQFSAVPPPNSLIGSDVGALSTDPHGFTGEATFAVLDANDEISSSFTVDFSLYTTLGDVITAVNGGLAGGSLSLTDGVLSFAAAAGSDGVAIRQSDANPSDRAGRGFSYYFGMNDLITSRLVPKFETGLTGTATHGFGANGTVEIEFRGPGGDVTASHTLDFSAIGTDIDAIITDLNANLGPNVSFALDGNGQLVATNASTYEEYFLHITNDSSLRGTSTVSFGEFFGVGRRMTMDPAVDMDVVDRIQVDITLLATATLDLTAAAGTPALTRGDNSGAVAMHDLQDDPRTVAATGDLPQVRVTLQAYANMFLSTLAIESQNIEGFAEDFGTLRQDLIARRDSESGVNLDEELSNMIIFQQSYNAAARMITTVNRMFDALLAIGT